jgi:hypothetical protein
LFELGSLLSESVESAAFGVLLALSLPERFSVDRRAQNLGVPGHCV